MFWSWVWAALNVALAEFMVIWALARTISAVAAALAQEKYNADNQAAATVAWAHASQGAPVSTGAVNTISAANGVSVRVSYADRISGNAQITAQSSHVNLPIQ